MIDYYYEIKPDTTVFGQKVRYLARYNFYPGEAMAYEFKMHDEALKYSDRVWVQNSNGTALVVDDGREVHRPIGEQEFAWIKLQARDIEKL